MRGGVRAGPPARRTERARTPRIEPAPSEAPDLQSLLAHALTALLEDTRAERAAAWWAEPGGDPRVVAAAGTEPPAHTATAAAFEVLASLSGATDLGARHATSEVVTRDGYAAAVPVAVESGRANVLLLLGGSLDAPGHVRPRTLALLDATARRLEPDLRAALAHALLARLDADVCRLDRLVALGTLVAEVVHEVRNPLVSVKTFLQLLPERQGDPEFLQSFLDVAGDELQRIERLLDLLLDHASARSLALAPEAGCAVVQVVDAIERLVAHRAAAAGVRLAREVPEALPPCAIAADSLRQVLLNLVLNALDATPPGGDVQIAARSIARAIQIDVEDRGTGIPRALRRRVFEPFFSTKPERPGGLGLAISRRLVEQAAGTIAIGDRPGGGTRFRIRLPATS